jgi:hypothetical protein
VRRLTSSFLIVEMQLSAEALSQGWPFEPMLAMIFESRSVRPIAIEVYCPGSTDRRNGVLLA